MKDTSKEQCLFSQRKGKGSCDNNNGMIRAII